MTVVLGWLVLTASLVFGVYLAPRVEARMTRRESGWQGDMAALGRCVNRVNEGEW